MVAPKAGATVRRDVLDETNTITRRGTAALAVVVVHTAAIRIVEAREMEDGKVAMATVCEIVVPPVEKWRDHFGVRIASVVKGASRTKTQILGREHGDLRGSEVKENLLLLSHRKNVPSTLIPTTAEREDDHLLDFGGDVTRKQKCLITNKSAICPNQAERKLMIGKIQKSMNLKTKQWSMSLLHSACQYRVLQLEVLPQCHPSRTHQLLPLHRFGLLADHILVHHQLVGWLLMN